MIKILIASLIGMYISLNDLPRNRCASTVWDVIEHIIQNPRVQIFGTYREKHMYAKGKMTKYGKLPFDSDRFLRYNCNINNVTLHKIGYVVGYSKLWNGRR